MTNEPPFTFEAFVFHADTEPVFELHMRYRNRIVWTDKTPVDFGGQYGTDDPYEPSTPLTFDDLTWALNRAGWRKVGDWDSDIEEGLMAATVTPTEFAVPQVTLPPAVLAGLA
jgi:hypothetical protein